MPSSAQPAQFASRCEVQPALKEEEPVKLEEASAVVAAVVVVVVEVEEVSLQSERGEACAEAQVQARAKEALQPESWLCLASVVVARPATTSTSTNTKVQGWQS